MSTSNRYVSCRTRRDPEQEEGVIRVADGEVRRIRGFREPLETGPRAHRRVQEIPNTEEQ